MKEVGTTSWKNPNTDASNRSLFTGLPGGYRSDDGYYDYIGGTGSWWSSTEDDGEDGTDYAWSRYPDYYVGDAGIFSYGKRDGLSVRCLRD